MCPFQINYNKEIPIATLKMFIHGQKFCHLDIFDYGIYISYVLSSCAIPNKNLDSKAYYCSVKHFYSQLIKDDEWLNPPWWINPNDSG